MGEVVFMAFLGLGLGALYAMVGHSIVASHLASGMVNFAAAAMAMFAAFQYTELRRSGDLVLPFIDVVPGEVDLPVRLSVADAGLGFWPALLVSLVMAVVLGFAIHLLVANPLRHASSAAKVAGSVGVLLYLQGVAALSDRLGEAGRAVAPVLPSAPIENFVGTGRPLSREVLYGAAIAVLSGAVLWLVAGRTRVGLATRAVAADEQGAVLLGISPRRISAAGWALAGVIAGVAGIVVGPVAGRLTPGSATALAVPALAAALIGRFRSFPMVTAAGLAIGVVQGIVAHVVGPDDHDWFPDALRFGVPEVVPFVAIVAVMVARRSAVAERASPRKPRVWERRPTLPRVPPPERVVVWSVVGPLAALGACLVLSGPWELALVTSVLSALLMLSYVVLGGYVGEVPLAQLALAGITGFLLLRFLTDASPDPAGRFGFPAWPLPMALGAAVAGAVVVGVLVGLPALRGRGAELAVVTFAAAVAIERWFFASPALTGVAPGSSAPLPWLHPGGVDLDNRGGDRFAFSVVAVVTLLGAALAVLNLRRAGTGRRFLAVRSNPEAADAAGVDVVRTKVLAVVVASALAGVAGALFSFQWGEVGADRWAVVGGIVLLAFAVVGGITSVGGALLGGLLTAGGLAVTFAAFHRPGLEQHAIALAGVALVVVTVVRPAGLASWMQPHAARAATCLAAWRGEQWGGAALRYGPWVVAGGLAGWLAWTRHDGFTWWMVLVGAGLGLVARQVLAAGLHLVQRPAAARPEPAGPPAPPALRAAWTPPALPGTAFGNGTNGAVARPLVGPSPSRNGSTGTTRPLLEAVGLTVRFGGVTAIADVDLVVSEGAVVGLVGPNGAGKSTLVGVIAGTVAPDAGSVRFDDRAVDRRAASARARLGLVRTLATPELFDDLSVRDNLMVAADRSRWWSALADVARPGRRCRPVEDQVDWAIGALGLEDVADEPATDLSHSRRKLVSLARAMAARPKLLVLDEPLAGLDHTDGQVLRARLADLTRRGTTVVVVDRDLGLALEVCETVHVLDVGMVIASGPPHEVRNNPAVVRAYLGSDGPVTPAPLRPPLGSPLPQPIPPSTASTAPVTHAAAGEAR